MAVTEYDAGTFQLLVDYAHSGTCAVTVCWHCSIGPSRVQPERIIGLSSAADRYQLPGLRDTCLANFDKVRVVL